MKLTRNQIQVLGILDRFSEAGNFGTRCTTIMLKCDASYDTLKRMRKRLMIHKKVDEKVIFYELMPLGRKLLAEWRQAGSILPPPPKRKHQWF